MTGNPTDDTSRADNTPHKDHDGIDGIDGLQRDRAERDGMDVGGSDVADVAGDAALDAVLSAVNGSILAALHTALDVDLDAGLAALYSRASHSTGTELHWEVNTEGSPVRGRTGDAVPVVGDGELEAICQVIDGFLLDLEPLADPAGGVPAATAMSVAAVYRLLDELRAGLLRRSVDRDDADRLARLAVHNATETRQLLTDERHRTGRPGRPGRRGRIDAWTATVTRIRDALGELRPRIGRLFDDAEDTAPHHPAPRLPV